MALTVTTVTAPQVLGCELKMAQIQVTFDNSYLAGGEVLDTSIYDMTTITSISVLDGLAATGIYEFDLVGTRAAGGVTAATDTLLAVFTGGAAVAGTTDLSTVVITLTLWGK